MTIYLVTLVVLSTLGIGWGVSNKIEREKKGEILPSGGDEMNLVSENFAKIIEVFIYSVDSVITKKNIGVYNQYKIVNGETNIFLDTYNEILTLNKKEILSGPYVKYLGKKLDEDFSRIENLKRQLETFKDLQETNSQLVTTRLEEEIKQAFKDKALIDGYLAKINEIRTSYEKRLQKTLAKNSGLLK